jgi:hypothetical protein
VFEFQEQLSKLFEFFHIKLEKFMTFHLGAKLVLLNWYLMLGLNSNQIRRAIDIFDLIEVHSCSVAVGLLSYLFLQIKKAHTLPVNYCSVEDLATDNLLVHFVTANH